MTDLEIKTYFRKSFDVKAVQVTADNIHQVAKWCGGEVRKTSHSDPKKVRKYIQVTVIRAINDKQTQAFIGDWVLCTKSGFKVYVDKAFNESFEIPDPPVETEVEVDVEAKPVYTDTNSGTGGFWMTKEEKEVLQVLSAVVKAAKDLSNAS
jgi:hypothetical protein